MSGPVPTLGYRSKSQAAVALRANGLAFFEIAAKLDVTPEIARKLVMSGRRTNGAPRRPASGPVEVCTILGASTIAALKRAAEVRKEPIGAVAARVLTLAARDNIIDAILDDGKKS